MGQDCDTLKSCSITGPTHGSVFVQSSIQALQNRIWNLGLNSKNPYKGKNQAFEAKLGLISPQSERSELGAFYFFQGVLSGYCCVCV